MFSKVFVFITFNAISLKMQSFPRIKSFLSSHKVSQTLHHQIAKSKRPFSSYLTNFYNIVVFIHCTNEKKNSDSDRCLFIKTLSHFVCMIIHCDVILIIMSQSIPTGYILPPPPPPPGNPQETFFERANPGYPGKIYCLIPCPRGRK